MEPKYKITLIIFKIIDIKIRTFNPKKRNKCFSKLQPTKFKKSKISNIKIIKMTKIMKDIKMNGKIILSSKIKIILQ